MFRGYDCKALWFDSGIGHTLRNKWLFCGTWPCTTAWLTLRLAGDYGNRVEAKHRAQAQKPVAVSHGQSAFSRPAHYSLARQAAAASFSSFHVATRTSPSASSPHHKTPLAPAPSAPKSHLTTLASPPSAHSHTPPGRRQQQLPAANQLTRAPMSQPVLLLDPATFNEEVFSAGLIFSRLLYWTPVIVVQSKLEYNLLLNL